MSGGGGGASAAPPAADAAAARPPFPGAFWLNPPLPRDERGNWYSGAPPGEPAAPDVDPPARW